MGRDQPANQKLRTRKDLLRAAAQLLKSGHTPTMDEVATEALVSRATAYRYFTDIEELLVEVPVDEAVPPAEEIFNGSSPTELAERIDMAEAIMHESVYKNEKQLRLLMAHAVTKKHTEVPEKDTPVRQNRRSEYIRQALEPYRERLEEATYAKLTAALSLIFGTESMIVFRDVLPLEPDKAREVKSWIIGALAQAALKEARLSN